MARGVLIPAADSRDLTAHDAIGLEDYQRAVGGWIEAVDLPAFGSTLFVNEEGLLRGLPLNRRATTSRARVTRLDSLATRCSSGCQTRLGR